MSRPGPLAGIRILDLTRLLPGPVATLHLADLGAEVIKIEDLGEGDYARSLGTGQAGDSAYFRMINRGKQGLGLDLKQPAGVDILLKLVKDADVVIESFRPGVMARLGIGFEVLAAVNPKITCCSITGYGQTGPYRDLAGHDINYLGYAGVLDQIGEADGAPAIPNFQIADLLGGALTAVMGILAGVIEAQRTGRGRHFDVAMTDSVLAHCYFMALTLAERGRSAPRGRDVLSGGLPCYAVYACADGRYMAVGALEGKFWRRCCEVLGKPDWIARQWESALRAEMAALFATAPRETWVARFAGVDCCVTPVLKPEEVAADPQVSAREMLVDRDGLRQFAPPLKYDDQHFDPSPAPARGEHTRAVLERLGLGAERIAELYEKGVIG